MEDRIKNLSLDQKAKLYYMMLLKKGVIDTLPEDPKAAYVQSMMDEPASSKFSEPMGEDHSDAENEKLKKISKELNKASKMHKGQADRIAKITKETNDPDDDEEQAEYDKGWYGESLKEAATELGYLDEEVDEQGLDQIERGLNQITGGGRQSASVSDRGDKIRVKFSYMRGEFDGETWDAILEYLSDNMGYKILDQSNYYERNWEPEEPAEAVPMIHLQK